MDFVSVVKESKGDWGEVLGWSGVPFNFYDINCKSIRIAHFIANLTHI